MILALIAAGTYAQTSHVQARMGKVLIAAGLFCVVWLLNGAGGRLLFSVGALCGGPAAVVFAYVMLAHPSGRVRASIERRFLWAAGGTVTAAWIAVAMVSRQPPIKTALLACTPHCPPSAISFGLTTSPGGALQAPIFIAWGTLVLGTALLLVVRSHSASPPVRKSLVPVAVVAVANATLLIAFAVFSLAKLSAAGALGAAYVECVVAIPLAILLGLATERMFMGRALAEFVSELARQPAADPEQLMASAIRDRSLKIAYRRPGLNVYVDSSGTALNEAPQPGAATWIERDGTAVAAVTFNPDLLGQEPFIRAAGAAALIRLEKTQLEAELNASMADLKASRVRLMETAQLERRRLERDLHDGAQQQLVGLRIKLQLAAEMFKDDPVEAERALAAVGRRMDDVLDELRSLARGIYPALLQERGLGDALKSTGRSAAVPTVVRALDIGRYPEDVEVAVYFSCLEALQNVAKHGGRGARAVVTLWEAGLELCFEVRDSGVGFDPEQARRGSGLTNIRDRIQAVGGGVTIRSSKGRSTSVRGHVPVGV